MTPKKLSKDLSPIPSGKVAYATTNYICCLFGKKSVHADFHSMIDFLIISPISYALTESPTIHAEIVQEMWRTAYFTIKGN